jgi:hypothetical protein
MSSPASEAGTLSAGPFSYREVLLWIASRSLTFVKQHDGVDLFALFDDSPPSAPTVAETDLAVDRILERQGWFLEDARMRLRRALTSGAIIASGRRGMLGPRQEIPPLEWIDLTIGNLDEPAELQTGVHACRSDWQEGEAAGHHYVGLLFNRSMALDAFPPPGAAAAAAPCAEFFFHQPKKKQFVTHPKVVELATDRLKSRRMQVTQTALAQELAKMWNEVPAWGGEANSSSFAAMRRRQPADSQAKSSRRKVR